ncbi:hypothetical protein NE237_017736 [Protea cynaroides]|uniref:Uncharacterized protein n=1 Tax=Protea cynaroides TaxID=273540 RepID=A0A9Q0K8L3_9MAGN|nr:hypothetical protein NE237_017736 [Protea cynaroides]
MSNRFSSSSLASCFGSTTLTMDLDPPPPAVPTFDTVNLSTCCRNVIGRVLLHMDLRLDNQDEDFSFRLNIKPFLLWRRHGSKRFNLNNPTRKVEIFWDLTQVKFDSGLEPRTPIWMIFVVGDSCNEAYRKTRAKKPEITHVLILRREHVVGNKYYTMKVKEDDERETI